MSESESLAGLAAEIRNDALLEGLQCYIVGGAVRDCLMGQAVVDKDWVVVGATPAQLDERGFIPVGADFPVFLHPHTKEEFALARTERKKGRGYHGFVFYTGQDVRLEDDLARRDLTMNAMAVDAHGQLIDPFGGYGDIQQKLLRHVGESFVEDPVRLLRLARFLARYPEFEVAGQTRVYARALVDNGEVDALVAERVWQEFHKGLLSRAPARMFHFLAQLQALERICPQLVWDEVAEQALACGVERALGLEQRYALLLTQSQEVVGLSRALRASRACTDFAAVLQRMRSAYQAYSAHLRTDPARWAAMWEVLAQADALRRERRFEALLQALACLEQIQPELWLQALSAVQAVDARAIAKQFRDDPQQIARQLVQARQQALMQQFGC